MNVFNFLREVNGEMKHMSWPTKKQTTAYSILVVVISIAVAAFVGAFDHVFTLGIEQLIK